MNKLKKIVEQPIIELANQLKDASIDKSRARHILTDIGTFIGHAIKDNFFNLTNDINFTNELFSVIVTTKNDSQTFGRGLSMALEPAKVGFMNFEGRRGSEALNTPVREINLPVLEKQKVDFLVVGKCVLATGCTAISLTKMAISEYDPEHVIIASIFYSKIGLQELQQSFPNAKFVFIGEPYPLQDNGMLAPIIYLPDEILK